MAPGGDVESDYTMLVLEYDGSSVKLKLQGKDLPGIQQSGTVWVTRESGKWTFDFGLGEEEYDEKDVPNPIKQLVKTKGGGPTGNAVRFPPVADLIKIPGYTIRPYAEYASRWRSRRLSGKEPLDKPLMQRSYRHVAMIYLELLGAPLYL
jgi:hypothetical protein